jgi:predicted permease
MNDLRFACRQLRKNPGFTLVAVLSLAVGIGANSAVFSLLHAVQLRSLPVRAPSQLRVLNWTGPWPRDYTIAGDEAIFLRKIGHRMGVFSYPLYCALRDQAQGPSEVFAFSPTDPVTAVVRGEASKSAGLLVSGNFFAGYGAGPFIGRAIMPEDDRPEAPPVVVITHRWWERHCDADPQVVGQTLTLNRTSFTIIGVLPREFASPLAGDEADLYLPLAFQPRFRSELQITSPNHYWLQVMLRLPSGASEARARASLEVTFQRHQVDLSKPGAEAPKLLLMPGRCGPWIQRGMIARPLRILAWIVAFVLVIGCANVAGLMLARYAVRQHELAVRAALGASRWRMIRQVLTESLVLALGAAGLGLVFAGWGTALLTHLLPALGGGSYYPVRLAPGVLAFTVGTTAMTVLLVGLLPALAASRAQPADGLQNPRVLGAPRLRLGKLLVVAQVAMALALVAGTGLMARTLTNLRRIDLGFNAEHLLVFRLNAAQSGYPETERAAFYERVREAVAVIPGVQEAAFADQSHLGAGFGSAYRIKIGGRENELLTTTGILISDAFLATMQIPMLSGRGFTPADTSNASRVAIVNQAFANEMFPGEPPLGKFFKVREDEYQVVGVCGNARYYDVRNKPSAIAYLAYRQKPSEEAWFAVRTPLPPAALSSAVVKRLADLDPAVAITGLTTQRQLIDDLVAEQRLFASLGGSLTLLAVGLAFLGVYGLLAYNVTRRTGEIGLRMALGASPAQIARQELGEAVRLAFAGAALGVPLALVAVRILRHLLYGVSPQDPGVLGAAVAVLVLVAIVAAWVPARRAARVDPMEALRCE